MSLNIDKITTLKALFCFYLGCGFFLSKMDPWMVEFHFKWQTWKERILVFKGNWMPHGVGCWLHLWFNFQNDASITKGKRSNIFLYRAFILQKRKLQDVQEYKKKKKKRQHGKIYLSLSWNELVLGCGSQHELNVTWVHTDALPQQKK